MSQAVGVGIELAIAQCPVPSTTAIDSGSAAAGFEQLVHAAIRVARNIGVVPSLDQLASLRVVEYRDVVDALRRVCDYASKQYLETFCQCLYCGGVEQIGAVLEGAAKLLFASDDRQQ